MERLFYHETRPVQIYFRAGWGGKSFAWFRTNKYDSRYVQFGPLWFAFAIQRKKASLAKG